MKPSTRIILNTLATYSHSLGVVFCGSAAVTAPAGDYDLGTGESHSLRYVAEQLADRMGKPRSLLVFDQAKDRGDTEIKDFAKKRVPGCRLTDLSSGLTRILSSIGAGRA